MTRLKCTYEGCEDTATWLVPQIAPERPCGWIFLPICQVDKHWFEPGETADAPTPVPLDPNIMIQQGEAAIRKSWEMD